MARVTIEDCILQVPNRFDLVVLASRRSRDIASGAPLRVERDDDKNPIVALREIADQHASAKELSESVTQSFQRFVEVDDAEEAVVELGAPQNVPLEAAADSDRADSDPGDPGLETADAASEEGEAPPAQEDIASLTVDATEPEISDASAISIAELTQE